MKTFIRTLNPSYRGCLLWHDEFEKDLVRKHLNSLGFYTTTGTGDSLDVYVIPQQSILDKVKKVWYTYTGENK